MIGLELQRALDAFPLEAWVRDHGFEKGAREEWAGPCPRCGKAKLVVNVRKRRWHCWVCQRIEHRTVQGVVRRVTVEGGGGVLRLVAWYYRCSTGEAARWVLRVSNPGPIALAGLPELAGAAEALDDETDEARAPPPPPRGACPLTDDNLSYLRSRGLSADVARAYGLFSCVGGPYHRRVVFPAWGPAGELLYWQARATWSPSEDEARGRSHLKMLNPERPKEGEPPQLTSEHVVFNLHRAVWIGRGKVAICEGPTSAIKAGDDAVSLWGKQLYPGQLRELLRAGVRAVEVMFDGPTPKEPNGAIEDAKRLVGVLSLFFRPVWLVELPAGDPGDHSREQNAAFRARAACVSGAPSRIMTL